MPEQPRSLTIQTFPGAASWVYLESGKYVCRYGALGGSGKRIDCPRDIAVLLMRVQHENIGAIKRQLEELKWLDVLKAVELQQTSLSTLSRETSSLKAT